MRPPRAGSAKLRKPWGRPPHPCGPRIDPTAPAGPLAEPPVSGVRRDTGREKERLAAARVPPHSRGTLGRLSGFPLSTPGKSSSKAQTTPSKPGGDRYIPHRSASQMEVASFLLSKENHPENSQTPTKKEHQKAWALNLNGFDVEEAKILRLSGKPQKVPEGKTLSSWVLEGGVSPSPELRGDSRLLFPPETEGREAFIWPSRLGPGGGFNSPSV